MNRSDSGFSIVELMIVVLIFGIIVAFAIPQAVVAMRGYNLHTDAAKVSAQINMTRFRATSQYAPYRMKIDTSTTPPSIAIERLCGDKTQSPASSDSACTPTAATAYTSFSTPRYELGTQYISQGDEFTTTNPGGTTLPGTITDNAAATTSFYFNTRGMPATNDGSPVANGGVMVFVRGTKINLTDAVVVSAAGGIAIYTWDAANSKWIRR